MTSEDAGRLMLAAGHMQSSRALLRLAQAALSDCDHPSAEGIWVARLRDEVAQLSVTEDMVRRALYDQETTP